MGTQRIYILDYFYNNLVEMNELKMLLLVHKPI